MEPTDSKQDEDKPPQVQVALHRPLPVCAAFVLCSHVIRDADDQSLSLIRVVDTLGPPPGTDPEIGHVIALADIKSVLFLRKGLFTGKFDMHLLCDDPTGHTETLAVAWGTEIEGSPVTGIPLISVMWFRWAGPGLYWLRAQVDGVDLARLPFLVKANEPVAPPLSPGN